MGAGSTSRGPYHTEAVLRADPARPTEDVACPTLRAEGEAISDTAPTPLIDPTRLLRAITQAQHAYIVDGDARELFDRMLADLLTLTDSEYGFIGEVFQQPDGSPLLKTHAITNIAWNEETERFYQENAPEGLEFRKLKSLFGTVMTTHEPVIANSPTTDPRRGGLPPGHPALDAFLGAPFFHGGRMVGMVGIANRPGGYDFQLVDEIQPLLTTCGGIIASRLAREIEQQSRHAQKMEAVGNLTSGVAHNFNNLLMGILPTLEFLRDGIDADNAALVDDALESARRARELVKQLMVFARTSSAGPREHADITEIVGRAVQICQQVFDRRVRLETTYEADLPLVACDLGEIEQVMMNILLNARDAVTSADTLDPAIAVRVYRTPAGSLPAELAGTGESYVSVRVHDSGPGMNESVKQQIFEPFFTTKDVGRGTGLGLATSYSIVRDHGGAIVCASTPGNGAVFTVLLPIRDGEVVKESAGQVLLIDDERSIHRIVRAVLNQAGFRVHLASDGDEATAMLRGGQHVDVVLLDRSLPGRSGPAMVRLVRELAPQASILYFTGELVPLEERSLVDGVITKPVERDVLVKAVAEALEA